MMRISASLRVCMRIVKEDCQSRADVLFSCSVHKRPRLVILLAASLTTKIIARYFTETPMFCIRPSILRVAARSCGTGRRWASSRGVTIEHDKTRGRPKGVASHWTSEKLATSDEYPLTTALNNVMHPSMHEKKTKNRSAKLTAKTYSGVHLRTQIVSPDLCGMLYLGRR